MSGYGPERDRVMTSAEAVEDMVLAGCVETREDGPKLEAQPLPPEVAEKPLARKSPAEWAYERLILYIQNFEQQLDPDQEIAMGFTGGSAGTMRIEGMGFYAPDIVTFYGRDEAGLRTQLIQHVGQLNVMLRALPKPREHEQAVRIGFKLGEGLKKSSVNSG